MTETILVTGATGNVGSEVVRQLASVTSNINIKAAGRSLQKLQRVLKSDKVKPIQIDYNKSETLREAVRDADSIFLVTPFQSDMVELTSNMLREAKKNDVEWVERIGKTAYEMCNNNRIQLKKSNTNQHTGFIIESNHTTALSCIGWAIEKHLDDISSQLKPIFQKILADIKDIKVKKIWKDHKCYQ